MTVCEAPAGAAGEDGLYVYCVARGRVNWLLGPIGLDYSLVYTVPCGGLCCVVHSCQAQPYQSEDPHAVRAWVIAHQRVVQAAAEAFGTVLPMAFNMIVQDGQNGAATDNLKAWMSEKRDDFHARLARLEGKAEYGVQIFWDREVVTGNLVRSDPKLAKMRSEALNKPKGLAYMLQQKLAQATRTAIERQANRYVEDFYARIRRRVDEVRVDKLKKTEDGKQMLLNLSCLASNDNASLGDVLEEIQRADGVSVRFTGPWPPYSFAAAA